jgi:hypothetical protein
VTVEHLTILCWETHRQYNRIMTGDQFTVVPWWDASQTSVNIETQEVAVREVRGLLGNWPFWDRHGGYHSWWDMLHVEHLTFIMLPDDQGGYRYRKVEKRSLPAALQHRHEIYCRTISSFFDLITY